MYATAVAILSILAAVGCARSVGERASPPSTSRDRNTTLPKLESPTDDFDRAESLRPPAQPRTTRESLVASPGQVCVFVATESPDDWTKSHAAATTLMTSLLQDYGLSCGGKEGFGRLPPPVPEGGQAISWPQTESGKQGHYFSCDVPDGHETTWLDILKRQRGVSDCDLCPAATASIGEELRLPRFVESSHTEQLTVANRVEEALSLVELALRGFYANRGTVTVVASQSRRRRFVIDGLRGVVIGSGDAWERLEVDIIATSAEGTLLIYVIADGYLASKLGTGPPRVQRYVDMSTDHHQELTEHLGALTVAVKRSLLETKR